MAAGASVVRSVLHSWRSVYTTTVTTDIDRERCVKDKSCDKNSICIHCFPVVVTKCRDHKYLKEGSLFALLPRSRDNSRRGRRAGAWSRKLTESTEQRATHPRGCPFFQEGGTCWRLSNPFKQYHQLWTKHWKTWACGGRFSLKPLPHCTIFSVLVFQVFIYFISILFCGAWIKPRISHVQGKCSTTGLRFKPSSYISFWGRVS